MAVSVVDILALLAPFALLAGWGILRLRRRRATAVQSGAFRTTATNTRGTRAQEQSEDDAALGSAEFVTGRGLEVAEYGDKGEFDAAVARGASTITVRGRDDPTVPDDLLVALTADLPLRDLALAMYRARGYEFEARPPGQHPWSGVLRHRRDPRRAYAFLCAEDGRVGAIDIALWRQQARAAGLHRLLVVTERGAVAASEPHKSVRIFDRAGMYDELRQLGLPFVAKLIAYTRAQRDAAGPASAVQPR